MYWVGLFCVFDRRLTETATSTATATETAKATEAKRLTDT